MKHKLVLQYPSSWWHDMWREGLPVGNILITQKTEKGFKHFERGLDLEKALAYQQGSDNGIQMRREVFVSRAEDIVVYHLTADTEKGSDYHVELETYRNDGENVREAMQEIWDSEQKRVCIEGVQMAHPMPTTINSTIDLAILMEFFRKSAGVFREIWLYGAPGRNIFQFDIRRVKQNE